MYIMTADGWKPLWSLKPTTGDEFHGEGIRFMGAGMGKFTHEEMQVIETEREAYIKANRDQIVAQRDASRVKIIAMYAEGFVVTNGHGLYKNIEGYGEPVWRRGLENATVFHTEPALVEGERLHVWA